MKNFVHSVNSVSRPQYGFLTVAEALARDWRGWHLSRKADGVCVRREWNGAAVWGDAMPDGSLQVWEIDTHRNQDVRARPWPERDAALSELFSGISHRGTEHTEAAAGRGDLLNASRDTGLCALGGSVANPPLNSIPNWHRCEAVMPPQADYQDFIRRMVALAQADNTPDGCVAKPLDAPFGTGLIKIKLIETYDVTVTDTSGGQLSVAIGYEGNPAGRVTVRNLAVRDRLRVGDIIEIGGTRLPSGKFREPRFLRTRPDKI